MPDPTDQPPEQPTPQACTSCGGNGGHTIDTSSDAVVRKTWQTCQACNGSGTQGGGI